jgi:hypothetical protein
MEASSAVEATARWLTLLLRHPHRYALWRLLPRLLVHVKALRSWLRRRHRHLLLRLRLHLVLLLLGVLILLAQLRHLRHQFVQAVLKIHAFLSLLVFQLFALNKFLFHQFQYASIFFQILDGLLGLHFIILC